MPDIALYGRHGPLTEDSMSGLPGYALLVPEKADDDQLLYGWLPQRLTEMLLAPLPAIVVEMIVEVFTTLATLSTATVYQETLQAALYRAIDGKCATWML